MQSIKEDFPHKDLTAKILEGAFTVRNTLGAGFLEKVYENALAVEFQKRAIPFQQQAPFGVKYDGVLVGEYAVDFVVGGAVVLELKAAQAVDSSHDAQLLNYLRATGLEVGLLLNFARPKLEYRRMALSRK